MAITYFSGLKNLSNLNYNYCILKRFLSIILNLCHHIKTPAPTESHHHPPDLPTRETLKVKFTILSEIQRPVSDGPKSKEDKTSSSRAAQTSPFSTTSRELSLNLRMSSSLEATKLSSPEIKDNNLIEDCSSSNTKLKVFSKEESTSQSRTPKEDTEPWITPESSTKSKIKSSNSKRKYKTSKKDSEGLPREKLNLKTKSSD